MLQRMLRYIEEKSLFEKEEKLLLAVSGGPDSVVMTDLMAKAGFNFAIAHCNFKLRGADADADEAFVLDLAGKLKVPFFSTSFHTKKYAEEHKFSIQMAARELRYQWLEETRAENNFDYISTAHHLNDSLETVLINLVKGTGISGMTGIDARIKKVVRPLLFATRSEIEYYARENNLEYRTDLSNMSDDYLRNKIRHHIVPVLKEINPSLEKTFELNLAQLQDTELLANMFIAQVKEKILIHNGEEIKINISELKKMPAGQTILFETLKDYNFTPAVTRQVFEKAGAQSGKIFNSTSHQLIKHGNFFILQPVEEINDQKDIRIEKTGSKIKSGDDAILISQLNVNFEQDKDRLDDVMKDRNFAALDLGKLKFPLLLRSWQAGDLFVPYGMKGRKKKLSDFLTDEKMSLDKKRQIKVLLSGNEIVWVVGKRIDERYAVSPGTINVFLLQLINEK